MHPAGDCFAASGPEDVGLVTTAVNQAETLDDMSGTLDTLSRGTRASLVQRYRRLSSVLQSQKALEDAAPCTGRRLPH